jgi:prepilin-type N-terminal cleavage/methylation domain-containing protein
MSHPRATQAGPLPKKEARHSGFSLVELTATISILALVLGAGGMMTLGDSGMSRRVATHRLAALIDQARNRAMTSRSTVMLAIAGPGKVEEHPDRCVLGLLQIDGEWQETGSGPIAAKLLGKWRPLDTGLVFLGGEHPDCANPLDHPARRVRHSTNRTADVEVYGIVFNHRGRMIHPAGDAPAVLRLAEGGYPGGVATPRRRGADQHVSDTWLQIGRVAGRVHEVRL